MRVRNPAFPHVQPSNDTVEHDEVLRAIPLLLLWLALPAVASDHTPPPVQPATSFAAVEVHEDEKVAIAAEPYDTREKEPSSASIISATA
jgi:hypothetical protein